MAKLIKPESIAEINIKYFPKKPAKGGIPAIENINIAKEKARIGLVLDNPERLLICST